MPRAAATLRRLVPLLLLLPALLPSHAQDSSPDADTFLNVTTINRNNGTSIIASNDILFHTADDTLADDDHEPVVRKKRTFGDIVFRGLADVLGYSVARKPPEVAFPPPLAPVPGIDLPLQAAATAAPAASAAPAPAAATAPCGVPRAAAPLPCRAQTPTAAPPKPRTTPPCPKPRAAPRRKPRPPPSPSPPSPCAQPRANPTTPSPCAPAATRAPGQPAPKADNLETITSNFRLHFNFNRTPAGAVAETAAETPAEDQDSDLEPEQESAPEGATLVAIAPRAARLPPARARKPRVYVDAFVVRNGVPQKVDAVDVQHLNAQRLPLQDEYLTYDYEEIQQLPDDDYEDVQESRDRSKAVRDFSDAVDKFWEPKRQFKKKVPANDYRNVHFGDRNLASQIRRRDDHESHQSLKREGSKTDKKPTSSPESESELEPEEEAESTTTTEDPKRPLRPRVLPPTEHNPGQIDTVTVRVPPIYKERRPKKLNRERPEHDEYLGHGDRHEQNGARDVSTETDEDADAYSEDSIWAARTERPARRKRRRKQQRVKRFIEKEPYTAGGDDYYGNVLPVSDDEKFFSGLTVPPSTQYAELSRLQRGSENGHFLDDRERIREDPEKTGEDERSNDEGRSDESERVDDSETMDEKERSVEDAERGGETGRADDSGRADERERTDQLSPNARIHETGFQNNYVRASNVQVDDPRPLVASVKKKTTKISKV